MGWMLPRIGTPIIRNATSAATRSWVVCPIFRRCYGGKQSQHTPFRQSSAYQHVNNQRLADRVPKNYSMYTAEDWRITLGRVAWNNIDGASIQDAVTAMAKSVPAHSLTIRLEIAKNILSKLCSNGYYQTCKVLLNLLPLSFLQHRSIVAISVQLVAASVGPKEALQLLDQLADAGYACEAVRMDLIYAAAQHRQDEPTMKEVVQLVTYPPQKLAALARHCLSVEYGLITSMSTHPDFRWQLIKLYLRNTCKQMYKKAKSWKDTISLERIPLRLVPCFSDVLVLLGDDRIARDVREMQSIQRYLCELNIPIYSFRFVDESAQKSRVYEFFNDAPVDPQVLERWKTYHGLFRHSYFASTGSVYGSTYVASNTHELTLLIPGPAIAAWVFGQPQMKKLLNLSGDPVMAAQTKLFEILPSNLDSRIVNILSKYQ